MAMKKTFSCPVCGEDVPVKAKACPHCGACEKSGWNQDAREADGLDLPGEDFDYEKFTQEEFGLPKKLRGKALFWKIAGIAIVVLMIFTFILSYIIR